MKKGGLIISIILLLDWLAYENRIERLNLIHEYSNELCVRTLRGRLQASDFRFVVSGAASHWGGDSDHVFCEKVNLASTAAGGATCHDNAKRFLPLP
jgi:hypothetical protein